MQNLANSNSIRPYFNLKLHDRKLPLGHETMIMGILNVTPDSFSDGGLFLDSGKAIDQAVKMWEQGADIIDIGGESTRPGAEPVPVDEEIQRVVPLAKDIINKIPIPVSVDTYKFEVAERVLDIGAHIINDISGLRFDKRMPGLLSRFNSPVVVMHIKGTPRDMQENPAYTDLVGEIKAYLEEGIRMATGDGLEREQVIVDVGIGFGKTVSHNLELINRLDEFHKLGCPILIGPSRKSFIGKVLNLPVQDRLEGTAAAVAIAISRGVHIVRVHDCGTMKRVARMTDAILDPYGTYS
ncbi:dihydropteroate synthase [bacterium]|nr:dihydropteroate synthase [bacterium]